jgi:S-adenosylmethionine hydrolase
MNTKKYCFILSFAFVSFFGYCWSEPDIYVFTDFGGGRNHFNQPVTDWQTAIELASEGWKLTNHPQIFINDSASPLNPVKAGAQLAAAFPYLGDHSKEKIKRIVIHVIDPGVGNASQHPRTLVLRKDGTLFIGPDNGTLSLVCPPDSIEGIWEINVNHISDLIGIDIAAGGTFHGRDVFAAAAYLLAADKVTIQEIGKRYDKPELKFRLEIAPVAIQVHFQQISTNRWNIKLSNDDLFTQAYFLAIVQSPFYVKEVNPQLFFIENSSKNDHIAIFNRKTSNLYVGPNNGIGTSFFQGFSLEDIVVVDLNHSVYLKIQASKNVQEILSLILEQSSFQKPLIAIDLLAHEFETSSSVERIVKGNIWVDAYGNIKTTLDTELFLKLQNEGYTNLTVNLNGITRPVQLDNSFANVPPGMAFIYVGSSGAVGPNPHRKRRYIELSSNGSQGAFGKDLFLNGKKFPHNGQEITFQFTKDDSKQKGDL